MTHEASINDKEPVEDSVTEARYTPWLRYLVAALAAVVALMAMYVGAREVARQEAAEAVRRSIGVVDIEQALAKQRARYLQIMSRPTTSDEEKVRATEFVKASTHRINTALGTMADECGCVLLIKPAVLQHEKVGLVDYTSRLLELVGPAGSAETAEEAKP